MKQETDKDEQLCELKEIIILGFPYDWKSCDPKVLEFYHSKEEVSIHGDIIMQCDNIVVPIYFRSNTHVCCISFMASQLI